MKTISTDTFKELSAKAQAAPRKRFHFNLHATLDDPVQRLCVAVEPGTYIRPHRHLAPYKWEMFIVLTGKAFFLLFDDDGKLIDRILLDVTGEIRIVEIPPATWHGLAAIENGSVLLEIKPGPYTPFTNEEVAPWAPAEGDKAVVAYEEWLRIGEIGAK